MNFLNYFLFGKQDLVNSGLKAFLNITQPDKEISKKFFKNKYPNTPQETIDSYFSDYRNLYDFAETYLSSLYKYRESEEQVKKNFIATISNKYKWVDEPNMEKLYDVCCFSLR
jgi:hypothetical protein